MKSFILLPAIATLVNAACNADNCARAVTGTVNGLPAQSAARKDCESFLKATVSPSTTTITSTATVFPFTTTVTQIVGTTTNLVTVYPFTETIFSTTETSFETVTVQTLTQTISTEVITTVTTITVPASRLAARAVTPAAITIRPSSVPAYASPCSGTVRYSSACSCFGVTPTTITLATPSTTVTVTASRTATIITSVTATNVETLSLTTTVTSFVDFTITELATATESTFLTKTIPATATVTASGYECSNPANGCTSAASRCGPSSDCACYLTDLGPRCMTDLGCGPICQTTSDCADGYVCEISSCCGRGNCSRLGDCANPGAASRIFAGSARISTSSGSKKKLVD